MNDIPDLEKRALYLIIDKSVYNGNVFKEQLKFLKGVNREPTGVGVYVNFELDTKAPISTEYVDAEFSGVFARSEKCDEEIGFILFVRGGIVRSLEAYTYSDSYPSYSECDYSLYYEEQRTG